MLKKNYLRPGLEWVYKLFFVVQSICMYASVATIAFTVLMRELFRVSIVWGYEIACWFVIILVFTSMPYNLYHKTNIGVTFVYDISPKVVKKIFSVIHFFVELACLIMMASGFKIWLTKVGMGIALSLVELFAEVIDLFVKKDIDTVAENAPELTIEEELRMEHEEEEKEENK